MIRTNYLETKAARDKERSEIDSESKAAFRSLTPVSLDAQDFRSDAEPKDFVHPEYESISAERAGNEADMDAESETAFEKLFPKAPYAKSIGSTVINAEQAAQAALTANAEPEIQRVHLQV